MQGVAEEFQNQRGKLWLVATGQERLEEVVEGLEGKVSELARLKARFPVPTVDLLPSDIRDVVAQRVLDKSGPGQDAVRATIVPHRQKFAANTRLVSETRGDDPNEEELVRLYPLVPYQIQLLIDAVSKRRSQVRSSAPMGGSNRTIIKHAQQLIASAKVGLGQQDVGALATMDRSYDLLEEVIPTSWRAEVQQVAEKYGPTSAPVQVIKTIALVHDVASLPLTAHNLAVLLHPSIDAESRRDEVTAALGKLVADDRIREVDGRYQLQSAEQKQWEQERKNIALGLGDEIRLRKQLLSKALKALTVAQGRTFSIGIDVDSEQREPGDITVDLRASTHEEYRDELRSLSRESTAQLRIFWVFDAEPARNAIEQLHKSERMLERRDTPSKTSADGPLIADEKTRQARAERQALDALTLALSNGDVIFRGRSEQVVPGELRSAAQSIVRERLAELYPQLGSFDATVDNKDVMLVLRTDDLGSVPESLSESGVGLTRVVPGGVELAVDVDPFHSFLSEVKRRSDYGQVPTGQVLERHFGAAPYGAHVSLVQVLTAAALRAGLVEVVHQGQRLGSAGDRRLDNVFRTLPAFRQTEIRPSRDSGPDVEVRSRLAKKLQTYSGVQQSPQLEDLARQIRATFVPKTKQIIKVCARLRGARLVVPTPIERAEELLERIESTDDAEVVTTAAGGWEDLLDGLAKTDLLSQSLEQDLDTLEAGREELQKPDLGLPENVIADRLALRDLLDAADYLQHGGRVRSLVARIVAARHEIEAILADELRQNVQAAADEMEDEFPSVDEASRSLVLRRLAGILPEGHAGIEILQNRANSLEAKTAQARRDLEDLRAAGRLVELLISNYVSGTISTPPQLEEVLAAIRHDAMQALDEKREVRLR
jgi:hypothetical protein